MRSRVDDLQRRLAEQHYVADRALAVSLFLALKLQRPLFLEGEAGVGKTALAAAVAAALGTDLIRLQCYEGLDITPRGLRVGLRAAAARAAHPRGGRRRRSRRRAAASCTARRS